ncbi:hypothetical protein KW850_28645 [Bacillus sp. sid0103]|uniref:hypothetical protein n=1 Tax=Bacillus sp. sid0103 TaxID=2856337 RepID=UPI001C457D20|nr:hypothetical protein [Bacillus sp. sid0103]MBV7509150.1 hypothetical protein [Bacillus sp. sid0103]
MKRYKLIEIGTLVRLTPRWGQVVEGTVISARHNEAAGRIEYEVLSDKDGRKCVSRKQ